MANGRRNLVALAMDARLAVPPAEYLLVPQQRHYNFNGDQHNHDNLQHLNTKRARLIAHHLIRSFDNIERTSDALFPLAQMKSLSDHAVNAGQVLIANHLERVAGALK